MQQLYDTRSYQLFSSIDKSNTFIFILQENSIGFIHIDIQKLSKIQSIQRKWYIGNSACMLKNNHNPGMSLESFVLLSIRSLYIVASYLWQDRQIIRLNATDWIPGDQKVKTQWKTNHALRCQKEKGGITRPSVCACQPQAVILPSKVQTKRNQYANRKGTIVENTTTHKITVASATHQQVQKGSQSKNNRYCDTA